MSNKKERKKALEEIWNPHILTLDQVLQLAEAPVGKNEPAGPGPAARAVSALHDRIGCRFTGPGDFSRLTFGERMVWELTSMTGEVLNGSFHQYLTNSSGDSAEEVKVCLGRIGAVQTLELLHELATIFPRGAIPPDREKRCNALNAWEERNPDSDLIDKLSLRFYRQEADLYGLMVAYARNHRAEFAEPADDMVTKLKRQAEIREHCCGTAQPAWVEGAEAALAELTQLAEAEKSKWEAGKRKEIKSLLVAGNRTGAIQEYRKAFLCSLAEAKAAVDRLAKDS